MKFYGDDNRWFIGTVKNYDPTAKGRLQVRIHGIHGPDISDDDLPYAEVMLPSTEGGVSGIGKIAQIQNTALVFGIFLDAQKSQHPLILGSIPKKEIPSVTQYEKAPNDIKDWYDPDNLTTDNTFIPKDLAKAYYEGNPTLDQKRLIIFQYLRSNDFTEIMAAGILGNLERENSAFAPSLPSSFEGENSAGLAQWNPSKNAGYRLQKLKKYASMNNKPWDDFFIQLDFIIHELRGEKNSETNGGAYNNTYNTLLNCDTFEGGKSEFNSTWVFLDEYENPANKSNEIIEREKYARKAYTQYKRSIENYISSSAG